MYNMTGRVRYSEVNKDGKLPLSAVLNYFQDCSTLQSEEIGQGVEALKRRNRGWFLTAWQVDIKRELALGEELTAVTWPHSFKGFYGERNYALYDREGELVAGANTLWALVDIQTGHPVRITDEDRRGYILEERLEMDYLPRKIGRIDNPEVFPEFSVRKCHLDTNGHVNNGQYIRMAEEYIPDTMKVRRMRAEYKKSAVYPDNIIPRAVFDKERAVVELCGENGELFCIAEFTGEQIHI